MDYAVCEYNNKVSIFFILTPCCLYNTKEHLMNEKQWLNKIDKDLDLINKNIELHDKQEKKSHIQEVAFLTEQLKAADSVLNDLSRVMAKYDVKLPPDIERPKLVPYDF